LLNIVYGKKFQLGLMSGISNNMGTSDALYKFEAGSQIAGILTNIQNLYRVAPHISYNIKNLNFVAEYEMTSADYGAGTFSFDDGLYSDKVNATNNRILLMVMYHF
jgi:hypothetical protein